MTGRLQNYIWMVVFLINICLGTFVSSISLNKFMERINKFKNSFVIYFHQQGKIMKGRMQFSTKKDEKSSLSLPG